MTSPLLRVEGLTKHFPVTSGVLGRVTGQVQAVDSVSFDIAPGETLGLVGESGCGKSTVGRCILRLIDPTSGTVTFDGVDVTHASREELTRLRRNLQIVFQDPFSSLNPRMRVIDLVGEALEVHGLARGAEIERRVAELLGKVGLSPTWLDRYPHEFSGGQRQRLGIARAIALEPRLVVCDEAVSALDVSVQAQVLNLLVDLRRELGLSYLFIAHDLSVVRHVSHRVAVMYLGKLVELAPARALFRTPAHPYTRALLSAIPVPVPGRAVRHLVLQGDVPSPLHPPSGCRFHTRCPAAVDACRAEVPPSIELEPGHVVSCVHAAGLAGDPDWARQLDERIRAAEVRASGRAGAAAAETPPAAARSAERDATGDGADETAPVPPPALLPVRPRATRPGLSDPARRAEPPHLASRAGAALTIGALLLSLTGSFAPLVVAALAYGTLVRPARARRARLDAAFLAAVVVAAAAGAAIGRARQVRLAERELRALTEELDARARLTGGYPAALTDLGWRLKPLFDGGVARDPWGRPFRYVVPGAGGRAFTLSSDGPDGVPSGDDVHLDAP